MQKNKKKKQKKKKKIKREKAEKEEERGVFLALDGGAQSRRVPCSGPRLRELRRAAGAEQEDCWDSFATHTH